MSEQTTLARPYAKAAFEAARERGELESWGRQMALADQIASDEAMRDALTHPQMNEKQAVALFTSIGGDKFTNEFVNFIRVLAENERLPLMPAINEQFDSLRQVAEQRMDVRVVSAIKLNDEQAERMKLALAERFSKKIELSNEVDASMLGGAVIYAGDTVIDGSLKGRLDEMAHRLAK